MPARTQTAFDGAHRSIGFRLTEANTRNLRLITHSLDDINGAIRTAMYGMGQIVTRDLKTRLSTGPRSGRIVYVRGRRFQRSAPGEFPARITGALAKSVKYTVYRGGKTLEFGETIRYARFLELGTSRMQPRPHVQPVALSWAPKVPSRIQAKLEERIRKRGRLTG
jgi:hypothetical protein